MVPAGR